MEQIGDGVAILQGTTERPGEQPLRQNNQFFYLTGVVEPRAIVVIDGRTKKTTICSAAAQRAPRAADVWAGAVIRATEAARATGVDAVLRARRVRKAAAATSCRDGRADLHAVPARGAGRSVVERSGARWRRATKSDPWDGRVSREEQFIQKLKARRAAVGDQGSRSDPRSRCATIKSPREIAIIREATRITGLGIMEAMRDAKPGMNEYELQADAEFVFKKYGAYGPSYFALIATGPNTYYSHYHKNTATLQDGDLVQFDYAPDYKYYQSDVTRVFPANGKFTPRQREFYTIYLKLYQALMTSITAARDAARHHSRTPW